MRKDMPVQKCYSKKSGLLGNNLDRNVIVISTEYNNPPFFFGRKGDYSKFSYF